MAKQYCELHQAVELDLHALASGDTETIPYSVYQIQSTLPRKHKLEQKQEKEEIVPKNFDSVHSAVNAI